MQHEKHPIKAKKPFVSGNTGDEKDFHLSLL